MVADTGFDVQVTNGRLHVRRLGPETERLVIGFPGVSSNLVGMERLGEAVPMWVFDPRGRGRSEVTPPGTYGWPAHARDVLDLATHLGHERLSIVGWSMGAYIAMQAAQMAPERVERVVLIDAIVSAGELADSPAGPMIKVSLSRLGAVYPSLDAYLAQVRASGLIEPWDEMWDRYYAYEMQPVEGGVAGLTSRAAVEEDWRYGETHDASTFWPALTMPTLLLRAGRPLLPGSGAFAVPDASLARFRAQMPKVKVVEVDANHFGIGTHPEALAALRDFFS